MISAVRAALLAAAGAFAPHAAIAQESAPVEQPYSMDQIAEAVAADLNDSVLDGARRSCISFVVDATAERRLRAAGAEPEFVTALRDVCFRGTSLQVTTEPAGAEVWVQGRQMGTSPWTSPMPVVRNIPVEVRLAGRYRRMTVTTVPDSLVTLHFAMYRDTLPLPASVSELELQALRAQALGFRPRSRPAPPSPPTRGGSKRSMIVGGLVGAAAGLAVGSIGCQQSTVHYELVDFGNGQVIETPVDTTEHVEGACLGFSIGGGAAAGGLAGNLWSSLTAGRRRRQYEEELRLHEQQVARWEEQRRAVERLQREEERRAERARAAAKNAEIAATNRNLGPPRITVAEPARMPRAVVAEQGR